MSQPRRVVGHILTMREIRKETVVAIPRRVEAEARQGSGSLEAPFTGPEADDEWKGAASQAWSIANSLVSDGRPTHDARLWVTGEAPLAGGSAGLALCLLFVSAIGPETLPAHFAVGHLFGEAGFVVGGLNAAAKARAASDLLRSGGGAGRVPFLYPPLSEAIPPLDGLECVRVLDAASALRVLSPRAYARAATRHAEMNFMTRHLPAAFTSGLPPTGPFALIVPSTHTRGDSDEDLVVGLNGRVLYRRPNLAGEEAELGNLARTVLAVNQRLEASAKLQDV